MHTMASEKKTVLRFQNLILPKRRKTFLITQEKKSQRNNRSQYLWPIGSLTSALPWKPILSLTY
jgi:hypothetical protein